MSKVVLDTNVKEPFILSPAGFLDIFTKIDTKMSGTNSCML